MPLAVLERAARRRRRSSTSSSAVTDDGGAGLRAAARARRGLRQRRHAVVREADAGRARLHPAAARGDGRAGRVAARPAAVEGRLRARLRLARRRDHEALPRRRHRREGAAGGVAARVRGLDGRGVRARPRTAFLRDGAAPDARAPCCATAATGRWSSCCATCEANGFAHLHRLGRRPRLHAAGHRASIYGIPPERRHRQLERAALPRRRATAARSCYRGRAGRRSTTARSSRCGSGAGSGGGRSSPAATPTATCAMLAVRRQPGAARRCACSSSTTTPSASSTTPPAPSAALERARDRTAGPWSASRTTGPRVFADAMRWPAGDRRWRGSRGRRSGWAPTTHYPEEAPAPSRRGRRLLDRPPRRSPTAQFAAFVADTGYVTVAERPLDPADFPGAPPENLVPGLARVHAHARARSTCATSNQWWTWTPGACWQHPEGPGSSARRARRPPRRPRRLRGRRGLRRAGPARRCRPRPSGSSPRAAGSTAPPTSGATSPSRPASGSPTTGTATSRGGRSRATGRPRPSARSRPTATACSTWPATSGSGPATGTPHGTRRTPTKPCCVPARPARRRRARGSLDPPQPQFAGPAQGHQGRLVPVRRQLLPALPAGGAAPADDRHRHEPHRLPLRAAGRVGPVARRHDAEIVVARRSAAVASSGSVRWLNDSRSVLAPPSPTWNGGPGT